ncbi:4-(cytidine 5'-diphospho)-2-C-methyl-D-erythritol kinase [Pseudalkalibacillus salsuginis]|uniref:4-(cytidine 5'-diphospho)-2-C-methyl-D-erythritol kinase n=1 Tax=Pseudalkalibacillus salsuginis TaxID=2910972 RepID=UPI001F2B0521|nr:4-(cytidine 5'-diphospho)-2-C-methyl-D-erythritol kinase [Pseudalkalibacillus salsuginis]MCF6411927.1 4-(cytidine 5'-diphospho)-2-C-methyl-D-erythritol kinase [Pseudalkalibacillus salsuginis]
MKISVKAPAKINLSLDVLHKREDGYHEVEMVMTTIDLADRIELTTMERNVIIIDSTGGYVPSDERNLAYQAADLVKKNFKRKEGVRIHIDKQIPVSAGLAGGSSDAAATLKGLNQLWDLGLSIEELATLGAEIGSDVSFCVYGGTALAKGRGEIIRQIPSPPPCWVVLAKPSIGVSTADVYRMLKLADVQHPDTAAMLNAIEEKDYNKICASLWNVLESVTLQQYQEVRHIKEQMQRLGAEGVLMSGSGPTVFSLTMYESRAQRIYNGLRGFCNEVYMVRMLGESE